MINSTELPPTILVKVPGKIMLAGEYVVLDAHPSLSATVNRWLEVTLQRSELGGIVVSSDIWPESLQLLALDSQKIRSEPLLDTILFACEGLDGLHLSVRSDLDISHGLGSSSALRLAVLLAVKSYRVQRLELSFEERLDCARLAWQLQRQQQGFASGYDVLTQLLGGLIDWQQPQYHDWPGVFRKRDAHNLNSHLQIYVGGKGAPTIKVGQSTRDWIAAHDKGPQLVQLSKTLHFHLLRFAKSGRIDADLIAAVRDHRSFFVDSPCFPHGIAKILGDASGCDQNWTYKTTGAGGEDALLIFGDDSSLSHVKSALAAHAWEPLSDASPWQDAATKIYWLKD